MDRVKYFMGCSGWYYDHWKGRFYPEDLGKSKWLNYYSEHFNTVEVNNTFYQFPSTRMAQSWYSKTPNGFVFTLKANQLITHRKKFQNTEQLITRFYEIAGSLKEKLGGILFQLPPFMPKNMEFLENITRQLDTRKNNVLEFRHESWWCDEVYALLKTKGVGFCAVSAPQLPVDLIATSQIAYIRFHGKNGWYAYLYSEKELEKWAEKIRELKVNRVFCYFNNDYNANAVRNCQQLKKLLEEHQYQKRS